MNSKRSVLALMGCVVGLAASSLDAAEYPADLFGRWDITVYIGHGRRPSWLEIDKADGKLTGQFVGFWGGTYLVNDLVYADDFLTFTTHHGKYRAKLINNQLIGLLEVTDKHPNIAGTHKWVGKKFVYRPNVSGTWTNAGGMLPNKVTHTLVLNDDGQTVSGTLTPTGEDAIPLQDVQMSGKALTFRVEGMGIYQGEAHGDQLVGGWKDKPDGEIEREQVFTRQRNWGEPVALFNGKDLTGWEPLPGDNMDNWKAEDGDLVNTKTQGGNIRTVPEFYDFKLHIEFNVPKDGNSGVYLRGRYEVQVHDSFGMAPAPGTCGSMYGRIVPPINACKKAGEWQTYDITLIGQYLTVVQNDQTIIDNLEIAGITGAAIDSHESQPGPIYLQGDHTPVKYRNINIWPAK